MAEETLSGSRQNELLFMQLVMMFQGMAMQQLGKIANPSTHKVERDLGQAKNFIDLIAMIEQKSKGNLNANEKQLIEHVLFELRMNYIDEAKKQEGVTSAGASDTVASDEDAADAEASGEEAGTDEGPAVTEESGEKEGEA